MVTPHVVFGDPSGRDIRLGSGGVIGRGAWTTLRLDDAEVSEAHALVTRRDARFRLLPLRGAITVNGETVGDAILRPKLEVRLSRNTVLTVRDVVVPTESLALMGIGPDAVLVAECPQSLVGTPPALVAGLRRDALLWLWPDDGTWLARARGEEPEVVEPGRAWLLGGVEVVVFGQSTVASAAGTVATRRGPLSVSVEPGLLRLRAEGGTTLSLGGNQAEFLTLLLDRAEPVHWTEIARYFWPEREQHRWRERFDAMVKGVRAKLREHHLRGDLLWSWDGAYRVALAAEDRVFRTGGDTG